MTYAIHTAAGWTELAPYRPVIINDVASSYETMLAWSPQYRTGQGIRIVEETEIPAGKIGSNPRLVDQGGKPVRVYDLEDAPAPFITSDMVNAEASRRIASGFTFAGKRYDYDDKAQKRITGAATLAGFAAAAGAPAGYMLWHGGTEPFAWIAMDNSLTPMDAPTCFAFGQAAASWESGHVFAGRALKDADGGIPADFAADEHWPAAE